MGIKLNTTFSRTAAERTSSNQIQSENSIGTQLSQPQILLVDDEKIILEFLEAVLEPVACKTICVNNFYDAISALETQQIDLLVSDIGLGVHNGMDVFAAARKKYPELPTMLITGFPNKKDRDRAINDGAFYFEKPISTKLFEQTIEEMIKQSTEAGNLFNNEVY